MTQGDDAVTLAIACLLALYLAFNLGANDVANAMGTSVGAKAVSLGQAIAIAAVLEFTGALLMGQNVSARLITDIISPERWQASPQQWLWAMLTVLLTTGLWLNLATLKGLPVSASHTVVGALTGVGLVAAGPQAIHWQSLGLISCAWVVTPLLSGLIAALFYSLIQHSILRQPDPRLALREWIPWLAVLLFGLLGAVAFPALIDRTALGQLDIPQQDLLIGLNALGIGLLSWAAFRNLSAGLESTFGRFQVSSASFVAFSHGANDVGNAVAPLGAIAVILSQGQLPTQDFSLPLWILGLGGFGLVLGLAVLGHRVIQTIGEGLIPLEPSSGFCAELATAVTVLSASAFGLPVSTSHALVGAVIGLGWIKYGNLRRVKLDTVKKIILTWAITLPSVALMAAGLFMLCSRGFS